MNRLSNALKRDASTMDAMKGQTRFGIVESYDPNTYAVKVMIQPDGVLSGWLPLPAVSVGSNTVVAGPNIGDQVSLSAVEGAGEQLIVMGRHFDVMNTPPISPATGTPVQSGEVGMFGADGSYIHLTGGNIFAACGTLTLTGSLALTGQITATGSITCPDFVTS
jgi:hypothetical protein